MVTMEIPQRTANRPNDADWLCDNMKCRRAVEPPYTIVEVHLHSQKDGKDYRTNVVLCQRCAHIAKRERELLFVVKDQSEQ